VATADAEGAEGGSAKTVAANNAGGGGGGAQEGAVGDGSEMDAATRFCREMCSVIMCACVCVCVCVCVLCKILTMYAHIPSHTHTPPGFAEKCMVWLQNTML
jgi:hypothetical protein